MPAYGLALWGPSAPAPPAPMLPGQGFTLPELSRAAYAFAVLGAQVRLGELHELK